MAAGTATLDFGAVPGTDYTSVDVTGLSGLSATSHLEAWTQVESTTDHSADEHRMELMDLAVEYLSVSSLRIHAQLRAGQTWGQFKVHYGTL